MEVIVVNDHLYPDGGADVVALSSAEHLAAAGVPVTLFVADAVRPGDQTVRRARLVCTGQHDLTHDPRPARAALQGLWNVPAAKAMRALLDTHDPAQTVVHLHSWTKSLSSSVVRAVQQAGFPLVCTLHDYFATCPTGGLFDFQAGHICHKQPMSFDCVSTHCDTRSYGHKLYRVARQAIQLNLGRLPGGIKEFIVVSRFSEALLHRSLPAGAVTTLVRNPIEVDHSAPADVAANSGFVMAARLSRFKGQQLFLEACESAGVSAVCIGEGPDLAELQRSFPAARFTGQLSRAAIIQEMRQTRALAFPSLWYETQGLVVDEAAALGVPAIVSDTCAATESVVHEHTGLVCRSGDVGELASALRRLHDDPALARHLGTNAYERFWSRPPTPDAHASDLLKVYAEVLARSRPARRGWKLSEHTAS